MRCRCDGEGEGACPRQAIEDGLCAYCVVMFPCDHVWMDKRGRIVPSDDSGRGVVIVDAIDDR